MTSKCIKTLLFLFFLISCVDVNKTIEQKQLENGKAFHELHLMIMNLKSWMKGIHHRISPARFQQYLNEFTYRFNRRAFIGTKATNHIVKMCNANRKIPTKKAPDKLKLVA